jgi:hypothetical protein
MRTGLLENREFLMNSAEKQALRAPQADGPFEFDINPNHLDERNGTYLLLCRTGRLSA